MVDFKKRLAGKKADKPTDPIKLYETLDRAHDKGPLRPAQLAVLTEWFKKHPNMRDAIVKLHTGQGKTLIGLLILQSRLNAGNGTSVYLCPDNYLIAQTCEQAKQFGIATCTAEPDLPDDFLNGNKILVTSVHKLFNGLTGACPLPMVWSRSSWLESLARSINAVTKRRNRDFVI